MNLLMGASLLALAKSIYYIQFILFAGKEALEIKRTFDQFTLAHSSLTLNFIAEGRL